MPKIVFSFILLLLISCSSTKNKAYEGLINNKNLDPEFVNQQAKNWVIKGSSSQQKGLWAESILDFQEALKYDSSAAMYFFIGKSYLELSRYEQAEAAFRQSLSMNQDFVPTLQVLADLYFSTMEYDKGLQILKKITKLDPSTQNQIKLASYIEYIDPNQALPIYEELFKNGKLNTVGYKLLEIYGKNKENEKYQRTLDILYKNDPKNYENVNEITRISLINRDYEKLMEIINQADSTLTIKELFSYYYNIESVFLSIPADTIKKYSEELLRKIDNRFIFDWELNHISSYLALNNKDTLQAKSFIEKAFMVADTNVAVVYDYARMLHIMGDKKEPYKLLNEFKEKNTQNIQIDYFISQIYIYDKNWLKAKEHLLRFIEKDTSNSEALMQIGYLFSELKQEDSTFYYYDKGLKLDYHNPSLNNNYAYALAEAGKDLEKALLMINLALRTMPNNPTFLDTYAWIQYKLGNFDEALLYIQKAISNDDDLSSELYEHLGDIYLKLNETENALAAYQKALAINSENEDIKIKIQNLIKK